MDMDCYDVLTFCHRHNISRAALYNAWKAGIGPRVLRLGSKVLITKEAAETWRRERERASEQPESTVAA
jgi:hypothetical protein